MNLYPSRSCRLPLYGTMVAVTELLRDTWVSLTIWSAQRSGGCPLGLRHDEGGVEASMSMAWAPG